MMPTWFPWMLVGGLVFIALSFIGSKYKDKEYKNIQFAQDFISGAILIALTGMLVPDLFPQFELPASLSTLGVLGSAISDDIDIQVGPPRLAGK
jgi:uncharacterized membrane protein